MRKEKNIFLLGMVIVLAMLLAGCKISQSTGQIATSTNDQLGEILDVVAGQETMAPTATLAGIPDSEGQADNEGGDIETPEVPPTSTLEPTQPKPTKTPMPTTEKTIPTQYALQEGEFPWCIARRFNLNPTDLLNANGIPPSQSYFASGQVLIIPQNLGPYEGNRQLHAHTSPYTVKSGDTFHSVACYFGDIWPEDIAAANGMKVTDSLVVGSQIIIP